MFGGLEVTKKKMGGLGKLSQFSGIKKEPAATIVEDAIRESEAAPTATVSKSPSSVEAKVENIVQTTNKGEKLVAVNIKITKTQKDWLGETASQVRDNNADPVPPAERVYPQHLIGVAIELLQAADVDWNQVKNIEELKEQLNL